MLMERSVKNFPMPHLMINAPKRMNRKTKVEETPGCRKSLRWSGIDLDDPRQGRPVAEEARTYCP
jgi:hypothetical protein